MDMSKRITLAIVIVFIIVVVCLGITQNDKNEKIDNENDTNISNVDENNTNINNVDENTINQSSEFDNVFKEIAQIDGMEVKKDSLQSEVDVDDIIQSRNDANKLDFSKYNVPYKKAIVNTSEESVNEVWLIKLGDVNQRESVARVLGNRLQELRDKFAKDVTQTAILERAIIKQENDVVMMIISPNENEIAKIIAETMS